MNIFQEQKDIRKGRMKTLCPVSINKLNFTFFYEKSLFKISYFVFFPSGITFLQNSLQVLLTLDKRQGMQFKNCLRVGYILGIF